MKKKELQGLVEKHRDLYYNGKPEISDAEFDKLFDDLKKVDPENPAVTAIGAPPRADDGWRKARHEIPMGSLNKVSSGEEMREWVDKNCPKDIFVIEKIDGLSIECLYEKGILISAITRGDGFVGDEITPNVRKMKGISEKLPISFTGSLRGEILLLLKDHQEHFGGVSNSRNVAAGTSRRSDGKDCENLTVIFYQAIGDEDLNTENDQLNFIQKRLQLPTPNYSVAAGVRNIEYLFLKYEEMIRSSLDYEIDGLVLKINSLVDQDAMGEHDNRPKGAVAYKFQPVRKETILRAITWQTGNSGRVTPVAAVDPVVLAGAKVENANLHNVRRVQDLGIAIGDTVLACRRGDVIPHIEEKISDGKDRQAIQFPASCPVCKGPVEMQGEYLVCLSPTTCSAQIIGRLNKWIANVGILEWGDALLARLVQSEKVRDIADLYALSIDELASLDRMGKTSAKKCYALLHEKMELPIEIILGSLSIPNAARSTVRLLADAGYDTLEKIFAITSEELGQIKGIGETRSEALLQGLLANKGLVDRLLQQGISVRRRVQGGLSGKKIAITGATTRKRPELQSIITNAGGEYKSSVSKGTTHLVIADPNSTSVKAESARKMGVELITEDTLLEMTSQ